ncbi:hypothetical protein [Streptococcus cuniculi]|uniref:hypothetical protein n=1 Tax=Streptococcus cuniculi TaxID=1432788 RepID=UPI001ADD82A8|nr:hypothetical protein [Streptococcus cuniculi]
MKTQEKIIFCNTVENLTSVEIDELNAFHARSCCMILKNDDYYYGLRANHFVVEEGWSERHIFSRMKLISANHKGGRAMVLIREGEVFKE